MTVSTPARPHGAGRHRKGRPGTVPFSVLTGAVLVRRRRPGATR